MSAAGRVPDGSRLFLGDGGLETTMIYGRGFELPCFASFLLLEDERGRAALRDYYREFIAIAREHRTGFTFDTPTWRASSDWGERLGYSPQQLAAVNRDAVELALVMRAELESEETPIAVCGTLGPRGDGYVPGELMGPEEAQRYHAPQIEIFATSGVDMVGAYTLTYADEAIGIVRAATATGVPVTISFTLETDGRLPSGEALGEAIEKVDAATAAAAAYFMVNCAHPSHFAAVVEAGGPWTGRLGGIRANASRKSHRELDGASELDSGNPDELAAEYRALRPFLPATRVLGGCCGTDSRHVAAICERWERKSQGSA
ncbi:MAG: homocysteine S-methyltransferase family protein [Methanosarcina sp.]